MDIGPGYLHLVWVQGTDMGPGMYRRHGSMVIDMGAEVRTRTRGHDNGMYAGMGTVKVRTWTSF